MGAGVLLDDLLVAEDLSAAETTSAALHAASSESSSLPVSSSHGSDPQEAREPSDLSGADGASVVMASPVAAPVNGDISMDISTENALSHGHRYVADCDFSLGCYSCLIYVSQVCQSQHWSIVSNHTVEQIVSSLHLYL